MEYHNRNYIFFAKNCNTNVEDTAKAADTRSIIYWATESYLVYDLLLIMLKHLSSIYAHSIESNKVTGDKIKNIQGQKC